ncbi:MAG: aldose epimerase family protein [Luteolibacter sp.]
MPADKRAIGASRRFGILPGGREAKIFTLVNRHGLEARVSDYGATLLSMKVPDRHGVMADVTLGFDAFAGWLANGPYFGATIGRFGNRIAGGKFSLGGRDFTLATNNSPGGIPCHLHGGVKGFDKALWHARPCGGNAVEFTHLSPDGDEGYPGNLGVKVSYTLTDDDELVWQAEATADAPTVVNIIHHSYWNLTGDPATPATGHELTLHARHFLPTDIAMIPTGAIAPVVGTPMDFTTPHIVGERIDSDFEALRIASGYDHCWVLDNGGGVKPAARLRDPASGRVMELSTDQPGIQFYAGNFIKHEFAGKNGTHYAPRAGLCLETQRFPDAPNQPSFPSCVLHPGETYRHVMVHKFSAG